MLYFDCYKTERTKRDNPWEYRQHASEDGRYTLCGKRVRLDKTWTHGSIRPDMMCSRCQDKLDATRPTL